MNNKNFYEWHKLKNNDYPKPNSLVIVYSNFLHYSYGFAIYKPEKSLPWVINHNYYASECIIAWTYPPNEP